MPTSFPQAAKEGNSSQAKAHLYTWPTVYFQDFVYPHLSCLNLAVAMSPEPGDTVNLAAFHPGQEENVRDDVLQYHEAETPQTQIPLGLALRSLEALHKLWC